MVFIPQQSFAPPGRSLRQQLTYPSGGHCSDSLALHLLTSVGLSHLVQSSSAACPRIAAWDKQRCGRKSGEGSRAGETDTSASINTAQGARSDGSQATGVGNSYEEPTLLAAEQISPSAGPYFDALHVGGSVLQQPSTPLYAHEASASSTDSLDARLLDSKLHDCASRLSAGELQRLAFARLLFSKPLLAVLDECTSALGEGEEAQLYELLQRRRIAYVSVGHRASLLRWHRNVLRLAQDGPGSWNLAL